MMTTGIDDLSRSVSGCRNSRNSGRQKTRFAKQVLDPREIMAPTDDMASKAMAFRTKSWFGEDKNLNHLASKERAKILTKRVDCQNDVVLNRRSHVVSTRTSAWKKGQMYASGLVKFEPSSAMKFVCVGESAYCVSWPAEARYSHGDRVDSRTTLERAVEY
jgi:hypothetical protein